MAEPELVEQHGDRIFPPIPTVYYFKSGSNLYAIFDSQFLQHYRAQVTLRSGSSSIEYSIRNQDVNRIFDKYNPSLQATDPEERRIQRMIDLTTYTFLEAGNIDSLKKFVSSKDIPKDLDYPKDVEAFRLFSTKNPRGDTKIIVNLLGGSPKDIQFVHAPNTKDAGIYVDFKHIENTPIRPVKERHHKRTVAKSPTTPRITKTEAKRRVVETETGNIGKRAQQLINRLQLIEDKAGKFGQPRDVKVLSNWATELREMAKAEELDLAKKTTGVSGFFSRIGVSLSRAGREDLLKRAEGDVHFAESFYGDEVTDVNQFLTEVKSLSLQYSEKVRNLIKEKMEYIPNRLYDFARGKSGFGADSGVFALRSEFIQEISSVNEICNNWPNQNDPTVPPGHELSYSPGYWQTSPPGQRPKPVGPGDVPAGYKYNPWRN